MQEDQKRMMVYSISADEAQAILTSNLSTTHRGGPENSRVVSVPKSMISDIAQDEAAPPEVVVKVDELRKAVRQQGVVTMAYDLTS